MARGREAVTVTAATGVGRGTGEVLDAYDAHDGIAVAAWLRFGKGRHPAALNFGDCLTDAVARVTMRPLRCIGGDFTKTDLELA